MTTLRCEVDHLIVACADLAQGAAWLEAQLGRARRKRAASTRSWARTTWCCGSASASTWSSSRSIRTHPRRSGRAGSISTPRTCESRAQAAPFLLTWAARTDRIVEAVTQVPALGQVLAADARPLRVAHHGAGRRRAAVRRRAADVAAVGRRRASGRCARGSRLHAAATRRSSIRPRAACCRCTGICG